jgi:glycosyltransferase involved in cell wall biosynthesis
MKRSFDKRGMNAHRVLRRIGAARWWRRRATAPTRARVVIIGGKGLPDVSGAGGVERGIEQLTRRLERLGVPCIVYERAARAGWRRAGRTLVRQLPFVDRKNHASWTHSLLAAWDYLACRRRGDVLHVHNVQNAFVSVLFRALGHRVVFHLHGQEWRVAKWGRGMALFMKLSLPPMLASANVVATVCAPSRRLLAKRFPGKAHQVIHVPNGVPDSAMSPCDQTVLSENGLVGGEYFLYAGRLVPQKRIELCIRALSASGLPYPLVIAGSVSHSSEYARRLEREVAECGLSGRVRFVGQIGWTRLLCLYVNCRAVVHPSDSEGCSNTLLESVASSACVICTDLPENRAILGNAALYVAPGDSLAVARAMCALESDEVWRRHRRLTGARQHQLETWDDVTQTFMRLYWPEQAQPAPTDPDRLTILTRTVGEGQA